MTGFRWLVSSRKTGTWTHHRTSGMMSSGKTRPAKLPHTNCRARWWTDGGPGGGRMVVRAWVVATEPRHLRSFGRERALLWSKRTSCFEITRGHLSNSWNVSPAGPFTRTINLITVEEDLWQDSWESKSRCFSLVNLSSALKLVSTLKTNTWPTNLNDLKRSG